MTTKQGCYFYAIKRVSDNTYYSYIYKDFMNLRQDTRLYKNPRICESQFEQCLNAMYNQGKYSKYNGISYDDFIKANKNLLKVATIELREV